MIQVMKEDIVPRLLRDVPGQPTKEQLEENLLLHRFTLVFDREGYSPDFFSWCKERRIACITYHKFPKSDWALEEFTETSVTMNEGQQCTMKLAERLFIRKLAHVFAAASGSLGRSIPFHIAQIPPNFRFVLTRTFPLNISCVTIEHVPNASGHRPQTISERSIG
jgi:hypothetical protein